MLFKQLNRLNHLNQLIRQKRTGNADALAEKLSISRRQVYNCLEELKDLGLEVAYSRCKQSYVYRKPYQIKVTVEIKELTKDEIRNIGGAEFNFLKKNCFVQKNCTNALYI